MNDQLYFVDSSTKKKRRVPNDGMDLPSGAGSKRVCWRFLMSRLLAGRMLISAPVSIRKLYPEVLLRITRRLSFVPVVADISDEKFTNLITS